MTDPAPLHIAPVTTRRCVRGPHDGGRLVVRPDGGPIGAPGGTYVPTVLGDEPVFEWRDDARPAT